MGFACQFQRERRAILMDMNGFVAPVVVLVVLVAFAVMFIRARRPHSDGERSAALFDRPCSVIVPRSLGFQIGSTFSISRVKVFPGRLVIAGAVNLSTSLDEIVSAGLGRRWFSQGVRVHSVNPRWGEVFIYVRRPRELIGLIEQLRTRSVMPKTGGPPTS